MPLLHILRLQVLLEQLNLLPVGHGGRQLQLHLLHPLNHEALPRVLELMQLDLVLEIGVDSIDYHVLLRLGKVLEAQGFAPPQLVEDAIEVECSVSHRYVAVSADSEVAALITVLAVRPLHFLFVCIDRIDGVSILERIVFVVVKAEGGYLYLYVVCFRLF